MHMEGLFKIKVSDDLNGQPGLCCMCILTHLIKEREPVFSKANIKTIKHTSY